MDGKPRKNKNLTGYKLQEYQAGWDSYAFKRALDRMNARNNRKRGLTQQNNRDSLTRNQENDMSIQPSPIKIYFILHPDNVRSVNDDQIHFISAAQLANLYGLKFNECAVFDPSLEYADTDVYKFIHLYPKYNGDYALPKNQ
jgi:hypothetical protein